jgi:RNA polymerase sigma-70 factor (ECF subfamily)
MRDVMDAETQESTVRAGRGTEAALLDGLRAAAPTAGEELYERFAPGLLRFATSLLLGDVESAEDLVVQTFAEAVKGIDRFDPRKSPLSAWLYGIARRRLYDEVRRRRRLKSVPNASEVPLESVSEVADPGDLASDIADRLDAQRQVKALAAALSHVEMEVLILQSIDELSAREIGQIVGRSERAVHSILHRARQKARGRLAQDAD